MLFSKVFRSSASIVPSQPNLAGGNPAARVPQPFAHTAKSAYIAQEPLLDFEIKGPVQQGCDPNRSFQIPLSLLDSSGFDLQPFVDLLAPLQSPLPKPAFACASKNSPVTSPSSGIDIQEYLDIIAEVNAKNPSPSKARTHRLKNPPLATDDEWLWDTSSIYEDGLMGPY